MSKATCVSCGASLRAMNRSDRARHAENCQNINKGHSNDRTTSLFVSKSIKPSNSSNQTTLIDVESSDFTQSVTANRSWAQQQVAFLHPNSNVHAQQHCEYRSNNPQSDKRPSKRAKHCHCLDCEIRSLRSALHSIDTQMAALDKQRSKVWLQYQAKAKSRMIDTSSYQPYTNAEHDSGFEDFILRTPLDSLSPPVNQPFALDHANLAPGQFWQLQASHITTQLRDLPFTRVEPRPLPVAPTNPFLVRSNSHLAQQSSTRQIPPVHLHVSPLMSPAPPSVSPPAVATTQLLWSSASPIKTPPPAITPPVSTEILSPEESADDIAHVDTSSSMSSISPSFATAVSLIPISANIDLIPIIANVDLTDAPPPVKANIDLTSCNPPVIADIDLTDMDDVAEDSAADMLDDPFDLPSDGEPGASIDDSSYVSTSNSPSSSPNNSSSPEITYVSSRCSMPPLEPASPEFPEHASTEIIDFTTDKPFVFDGSVVSTVISTSSVTVSQSALPPLPPAKPAVLKVTSVSSKDDNVLFIESPARANQSDSSFSFPASQPAAHHVARHVTRPVDKPVSRSSNQSTNPPTVITHLASPLPSPLSSPIGAPLISPRYSPIDITKPSSWSNLSFVNLVAAVGAGAFDFTKVSEPILAGWMNELGLKAKSCKQMQERLTDILQTLKTAIEPPARSPAPSPINSPAQAALSQELVHNVRTFIRNHESLWLDVLLAQNIDFNCLYSCLQGAGIPVNKTELTAVLDAENIIFTQTNKSKPRHRQKASVRLEFGD